MAKIVLETRVAAPPERCFDLSRDLDLHLHTMNESGERIVAGRDSGLIELGEEVTWEARHFGIRHRHTSRITLFDRPRHFRDTMVKGRFAKFEHDHFFAAVDEGTLMRDILEFASPFGLVGRLVDWLALKRYLSDLLSKRNQIIKRQAEVESGPLKRGHGLDFGVL